MTVHEVLYRFLVGDTKAKASGGRLTIQGDKLVHYETTIAQRIHGCIVVNTTKYSRTTSKYQKYLLDEMPNVETVTDVPEGCFNLERYVVGEGA